MNFDPENTILQVKQALQEKEGITVDQIRLIYSGKPLADDKSLSEYRITGILIYFYPNFNDAHPFVQRVELFTWYCSYVAAARQAHYRFTKYERIT